MWKSRAILAAAACASVQANAAADDVQQQFNRAAWCRVHAQLLPAMVKQTDEGRAFAAYVHDFWIKRSDALWIKMGKSPESAEIAYLLIEITPDKERIKQCVSEAAQSAPNRH